MRSHRHASRTVNREPETHKGHLPTFGLTVFMLAYLGLAAGCQVENLVQAGRSTSNDNVAQNNPLNTNGPANADLNANENQSDGIDDLSNDNVVSMGNMEWNPVFDGNYTGVLTSVWGSGNDDIYAVGGVPEAGEIYHFDGDDWRAVNVYEEIALLNSVYGFDSDEVYVVGDAGLALRYSGAWSSLATGTTEALRSVWGPSPTDLWVVGGDLGDGTPPILLHWDGFVFTAVDVAAAELGAALFDVWGSGATLFAVGAYGLILERGPSTGVWRTVDAGLPHDRDFWSIAGTGPDDILVVGGSGVDNSIIVHYDGSTWTTLDSTGLPSLRTVYSATASEMFIAGSMGYLGRFDTGSRLIEHEPLPTVDSVRGLWSRTGTDQLVLVGGRFSHPFTGLAQVRVIDAEELVVGAQPDWNGDGFPDAPIGTCGERPDNSDALNSSLSVGSIVEGEFVKIQDGSDVLVHFDPGSGSLLINPLVLVTGFPEEANQNLATVCHTLTLETDGTVLSHSNGSLAVLNPSSVLTETGAYQVYRIYGFDYSVSLSDIDDQFAELQVLVSYGELSPPIIASGTTRVRLIDPTKFYYGEQ